MNRLEKIYELTAELRLQITAAMSEGLAFYPHNIWARNDKVLRSIADWALGSMSHPIESRSETHMESAETSEAADDLKSTENLKS